ncbi:CmpA/NrtA family ABC transporter substrate-binding protein [Azohydromonas sediminis]|uniref:CmpA/NrtA family ABC transporter substrate-binding protein n=1 Tax=Azohydromonas sediminis TaxID=2259674 RepID=UPI000E648124|nr:CmpA/NrtA family ABC transporter substrate-binding protein [Azohydromonas sediminis]
MDTDRNAALDPYDADRPLRLRCACGGDHAPKDHARCATPATAVAAAALDEERVGRDLVEATLVKALFPHEPLRRAFLKAVGRRTAMAAIASVVPLASLQAMAQERKPPEKKNLNIGFLPITCATPIVAADPLGFYAQEGLQVSLQRTAGWAVIRDKTLAGEFDASQMLSPMPLAITLGLGSTGTPMVMPAMDNINGNAITLGIQHKDRRDPKTWKGMRFAIPFDHSMHNYLLRHYLAANGIDPDRDVQLRVMPPPDMVANLRSGNIDGFIVAEPFNQRAVVDGVGFIHMLTSQIWDGHPCCAFVATEKFARELPNTFAALFRTMVRSAMHCSQPANRKAVAEALAGPNYLNQPPAVLEQVLLGRFADGLGNVRNVPTRIDFDPFPWHSMAVWMLTQMKRWGYVSGDVDYAQIARRVFLATDAQKLMAELGFQPPATTMRTHTILGQTFDPARPEQYLSSLPMVRS